MLIEESEQLSMEEWAAIMQKYDKNIDWSVDNQL
jgi:hypothetical protein